ncbi:MAG: hypothetical protein HYY06_27370 [Deltaproteobacteria bacterium]|nr:hypothetical protein [Deltaproteobacteria bacterium]
MGVSGCRWTFLVTALATGCGGGAASRPPEAPQRAAPCGPAKEADAGASVQVTMELTPDRACGGRGNLACDAAEFCDHASDQPCTRPGASGVCRPRPSVCGDFWEPVCGCDGRPYRNACAANLAGTEIAAEGQCLSAGATHPDPPGPPGDTHPPPGPPGDTHLPPGPPGDTHPDRNLATSLPFQG